MSDQLYDIKNISLYYQQTPVFADLSFTLPKGKWTAILGASGVGKSSLLRALAGMIPDFIHEPQNLGFSPKMTAYLSQSDSLLPWLSVLQNALVSLRLRAHSHEEKQQKIARAKQLLHAVQLENAHDFYPAQLSGGMRQRVALVRTLLEDKSIILLDEPFASLDAITRFEMQQLAAAMLDHQTVILVTHDPAEALRLADQIYIFHGKPATLAPIKSLSTPTPRDLVDPELCALQTDLYRQLSLAIRGEACSA